jgi:hypothetical protein
MQSNLSKKEHPYVHRRSLLVGCTVRKMCVHVVAGERAKAMDTAHQLDHLTRGGPN